MNQHTRIVTSLYRKLLKQHRMLPLELQGLGVQYIKDEFRRHKGADSGQATIFLNEWRVSETTFPPLSLMSNAPTLLIVL